MTAQCLFCLPASLASLLGWRTRLRTSAACLTKKTQGSLKIAMRSKRFPLQQTVYMLAKRLSNSASRQTPAPLSCKPSGSFCATVLQLGGTKRRWPKLGSIRRIGRCPCGACCVFAVSAVSRLHFHHSQTPWLGVRASGSAAAAPHQKLPSSGSAMSSVSASLSLSPSCQVPVAVCVSVVSVSLFFPGA